jgi:hypothetical protein
MTNMTNDMQVVRQGTQVTLRVDRQNGSVFPGCHASICPVRFLDNYKGINHSQRQQNATLTDQRKASQILSFIVTENLR